MMLLQRYPGATERGDPVNTGQQVYVVMLSLCNRTLVSCYHRTTGLRYDVILVQQLARIL
jgi:hypothetical protein